MRCAPCPMPFWSAQTHIATITRPLRCGTAMNIQPAKIVMTRSGNLDRNTRFFTEGAAEKIVLTSGDPCDHLKDIATIIPFDGSAHDATCQLQAHGIKTLMIEGGAQIQQYFLDAGTIDEIRLSKIGISSWMIRARLSAARASVRTVVREQTAARTASWHATAKTSTRPCCGMPSHKLKKPSSRPVSRRLRHRDAHHRIIGQDPQETDATCHAEQAAIDKP